MKSENWFSIRFSLLRIFSVNLTTIERLSFLVGDTLENPGVSAVNCKYNHQKITPKIKFGKLILSFDSALCASNIKMEAKLMGGGAIII